MNARNEILMLIDSLAEFPGNSLAPGFPKSMAYQTPDDIFLFEGTGKRLFKVLGSAAGELRMPAGQEEVKASVQWFLICNRKP